MVEKIEKNNKFYFACSVCGFVYDKEEIAKSCENWCSTHKTCSLQITKHALYKNKYDIK